MADQRSDGPPVLVTRGLSRNFGGLAAVRNVSIALHRGELHALIGPNGAGKSTLVDLLSGELRPSAGSVALFGRDITGARNWHMAHLGVGRSFQRTNIFPSLTVQENVRLGVQAVSAGRSDWLKPAAHGHDLIERAGAVLYQAGLFDMRDHIAGLLSHGHQRQLEIAMALAGAPKVLLLDEPLAGMGPEESARMMVLLKGLVRDTAMLLVEHDMDFVFAVADWMTVMVDGTVLADGRPPAIRDNASVQEAYLGGTL